MDHFDIAIIDTRSGNAITPVDNALRILATQAPARQQSCCGSPMGSQDTVDCRFRLIDGPTQPLYSSSQEGAEQ